MTTVTVVGAEGAVGRMYVDACRASGLVVHAVDRATGGDITRPDASLQETLSGSDIVMLAIPEPAALGALAGVTALLRPDALVVDTLSVKTDMSRTAAAARPRCGVVGVNPMFAPSLGMSGRVTALVVYDANPRVAEFTDLLTSRGTRVVRVDAEQHDRTVATTQALTHAAVLAFGTAAARLGVDPDLAIALGPPPHATMSALLARIATGTPEVYHDVQHGNPYAAAARLALADAVRDLDSAAATEPEFATAMSTAATALGSDTDSYREHCAALFAVPFRHRSTADPEHS